MKSRAGSAEAPSAAEASNSRYLWLGIACLLLGLGLWTVSNISDRNATREIALNSLAALTPESDAAGTRDQEKQALDVARVQLQLLQASRDARRILLQTALQDPKDAARLKGREQGLSVALSQVRSQDARLLFQEAILPTIRNSNDAADLKEAIDFFDRWSIAGTLSAADSDGLCRELVEKMLKTEDTDVIDPLATGVTSVAENVSPAVSDDLAWKLAQRSTEETKSSVSDARMPALLALERALGTDSAGKLASKLNDRMLAEQDPFVRRTLAMEARDPDAKVSQTIADSIADKVVERMIPDLDPTSIGAWGTVIESLKDVISPAKAGELAQRLSTRILFELGLGSSEELFTSWRGLAEKATPEQSEKLVEFLTGALRLPLLDSQGLRRSTATMVALNAPPAAFVPAGEILLGRMRAETDPQKLSVLGSSVAVLRVKVPTAVVDSAADLIVRRMLAESDPEALGPLAGAVDDLDEGISKPKIRELASVLASRIGGERNSTALLNLAVGFVALAQQMDGSPANDIAAPLLARMDSENSARVLRALAFSVGTIEDRVSPAKIRSAGAKLASAMATETDADRLRSLAAGLCALQILAGQENLARAITILEARIGIEDNPADLFNLTSSLHAIAYYATGVNFQLPASNLVSRMVEEKNAGQFLGLSRSLRKIAPDLSADLSAKLASDLAAALRNQHDPDLMRAYGEVLGSLSQGSLSEAQLRGLQNLFAIPEAPCQVATRVKTGPRQLAPEILNPLCSEDSWVQVVSAFDDAVKGSIVRAGTQPTDSTDADFTQLVVADDDDEATPAAAPIADTRTEVDFNKLSDAMDAFRPGKSGDTFRLAVEGFSSSLLVAGLICLYISWRRRVRDA